MSRSRCSSVLPALMLSVTAVLAAAPPARAHLVPDQHTPPERSSDLSTVLAPGMVASITDTAGREASIRILRVEDDVVVGMVRGELRQFPEAEVARVRVRVADTLLDGALVGAGVGLAWGLSACRLTESWDVCRQTGPLLQVGLFGAAVGVGLDALLRDRLTIYDARTRQPRVHVSPLVGPAAGGARLTLQF